MRVSVGFVVALASLASSWTVTVAATDFAQGALRDWTVRDSVAVTYFAGDMTYPEAWMQTQGEVVYPSPDGSRFFFLTLRGDVDCDCNVSTLSVLSVKDIQASLKSSARTPPPARRAEMRSARGAFMTGIQEATWHSANEVVFRGISGTSAANLYRLNATTGEVAVLAEAPAAYSEAPGVGAYGVQGDVVVYDAPTAIERGLPLNEYPAQPFAGREILGLQQSDRGEMTKTLFVRRVGEAPRQVTTFRPLGAETGIRLSPDGRWAVVTLAPLEKNLRMTAEVYDLKRSGDLQDEFFLLDVTTGTLRSMVAAPVGRVTSGGHNSGSEAFWSPDSRRVMLFNTAMPVTEKADEHRSTAYVVEYDVASGESRVISTLAPPKGARFEPPYHAHVRTSDEGRTITAFYYESSTLKPLGTISYRWNERHWRESNHSLRVQPLPRGAPVPVLQGGLRVTLRESANDPPTLPASDGKREIALTGPDPALLGVWRARAEAVEWNEADGVKRGLLMRPRTSQGAAQFALPGATRNAMSDAAQPPPLVIQAYHYLPDLFRPDGPYPTGYAAQPLVARGFAVLQLDIPAVETPAVVGTNEGPRFVARVDAAVESLAARGVIDPKRVGLVGFSRGGYMAMYAATHPGRTNISSAVVADSTMVSFGGYVYEAALSGAAGSRAQYEDQYGGSFWSKPDVWLKEAPLFNLNRSHTPTLLAYNQRQTWVSMVELLGAFRLSGVPHDLIVFPRSYHQLVRPRERMESMTATVEWMDFWLRGKAPAEAERAQHWMQIRESAVSRR